jgi:hypothetical protein
VRLQPRLNNSARANMLKLPTADGTIIQNQMPLIYVNGIAFKPSFKPLENIGPAVASRKRGRNDIAPDADNQSSNLSNGDDSKETALLIPENLENLKYNNAEKSIEHANNRIEVTETDNQGTVESQHVVQAQVNNYYKADTTSIESSTIEMNWNDCIMSNESLWLGPEDELQYISATKFPAIINSYDLDEDNQLSFQNNNVY